MTEAASRVSLARPVDAAARRKPAGAAVVIGTSMPRTGLPAKVFGCQAFIHDLRPKAGCSAPWRAGRAMPPGWAWLDLAGARSLPGMEEVMRDDQAGRCGNIA